MTPALPVLAEPARPHPDDVFECCEPRGRARLSYRACLERQAKTNQHVTRGTSGRRYTKETPVNPFCRDECAKGREVRALFADIDVKATKIRPLFVALKGALCAPPKPVQPEPRGSDARKPDDAEGRPGEGADRSRGGAARAGAGRKLVHVPSAHGGAEDRVRGDPPAGQTPRIRDREVLPAERGSDSGPAEAPGGRSDRERVDRVRGAVDRDLRDGLRAEYRAARPRIAVEKQEAPEVVHPEIAAAEPVEEPSGPVSAPAAEVVHPAAETLGEAEQIRRINLDDLEETTMQPKPCCGSTGTRHRMTCEHAKNYAKPKLTERVVQTKTGARVVMPKAKGETKRPIRETKSRRAETRPAAKPVAASKLLMGEKRIPVRIAERIRVGSYTVTDLDLAGKSVDDLLELRNRVTAELHRRQAEAEATAAKLREVLGGPGCTIGSSRPLIGTIRVNGNAS